MAVVPGGLVAVGWVATAVLVAGGAVVVGVCGLTAGLGVRGMKTLIEESLPQAAKMSVAVARIAAARRRPWSVRVSMCNRAARDVRGVSMGPPCVLLTVD